MAQDTPDENVMQAEKTLSLPTFLGWNKDKYIKACELYKKAGNQYKLKKSYIEAGICFSKSYEAISKDKSCEPFDKLDCLKEAVSCYKQNQLTFDRAVECYQLIISLYETTDKCFNNVGKYANDFADLFAKRYVQTLDDNDLIKAIEYYQKSADNYDACDSSSYANKSLNEIARLNCALSRYETACEIYEKLAIRSVDNNLLKYSVSEYLFDAGLCKLICGDVITIRKTLQRYVDVSELFNNSRQYKLLITLTDCLENNDDDQFRSSLKEYDSLSKLKDHQTTILLKLKALIKNQTLEEDQTNLIL